MSSEVLFEQTFAIKDWDFAHAGEASVNVKNILKDIGYPADIIRRVAVASFEAEMNVVMYGKGGEMHFKVTPKGVCLVIEDQVTNTGGVAAPHMILYHINLGFPLLQAGSRLVAPSQEVIPRDETAVPGLDEHTQFHAPTPGYAEQVFFHRMRAEDDGFVNVLLTNDSLGIGLQLRYRQQELPEFTQWKQMGWGIYTLGIEPGNCRPEGRVAAREREALVELAPGEQVSYQVEISVLAG